MVARTTARLGAKRESDQVVSGDHEAGFLLRSDAHDAAFAVERGGDVQVAVDVEGEALGTTEATVEHRDFAFRTDHVYGVEAAGRGPGDVEVAVRAERQVIGGDAGLESGEDVDLAIASDLEDGAAAVADEEIFLGVEGDASGDAHAFGVGGHGAVRGDAIHRAVEARGDVEMAGAIEGHAGRVHHLAEERLDAVVGIDLVDRHRNLLAARPGEGDVEIAFVIDGGIGDRMQVLGDRHGDAHHAFIAGDSH